MNPTDLRPTAPQSRRRRGEILGLVVAIAVGAALFSAAASTLRVPANLPEMTIENPTVYQVNVEVSPSGSGGWLDLGAVGRDGNKTVEQVADQGRTWVFRFSYGGVDAGRVTRSRAELASAHWTVTVPKEVEDRLRAAGLQPSAF